MVDIATTWLRDAEITKLCGNSLANTLYRKTLTIGLSGDLGAGKTTFLQGFLSALGVKDGVTSPTYALEQRYTGNTCEIIHIDLYRLQAKQAEELLSQTDDFEGIRCIEWIGKAGSDDMCDITVHLEDGEDGGRNVRVEFRDMSYPTATQIKEWRKDMDLPEHIAKHCDAVASFSVELTKDLLGRGILVRPEALHRAAMAHDLFRFVDFKEFHNKDPEQYSEQERIWYTWKSQYPNMRHEAACAAFLAEHNYTNLASIVAVHGLEIPSPPRDTIEQKILCYADKRVMEDKVVSVKERFDDFAKRYGDGKISEEAKHWYAESLALEKELGFLTTSSKE